MFERQKSKLVFADLGIDFGRVRYLPGHDKILGVLGLVRREFRRESGVSTVGSFDNRWEF